MIFGVFIPVKKPHFPALKNFKNFWSNIWHRVYPSKKNWGSTRYQKRGFLVIEKILPLFLLNLRKKFQLKICFCLKAIVNPYDIALGHASNNLNLYPGTAHGDRNQN
jgi:hypothetical protein